MSASFTDRNGRNSSRSVELVLDDTPPGSITMNLPSEHVKGQMLKVAAKVVDKETTPIKQVVFFVGPPPGPDGKRAADPLKVEGVRDPSAADRWTAELPIPADAKGILQVGVVATNEVGLDGTEAKNIKLVDAPAPAGDLQVTVLRGNRPQQGVEVKLKDAEGKEKGVATTKEKGIAKFEKLPPGVYTISAAKADSGSGSKGEVTGKVEIGKVTEVTLTLKRGQ
jgi:hypothetical protein